jgi:hypothetical protein
MVTLMKAFPCLVLFLQLLKAKEFFISPSGDDSWTGNAPEYDGIDGPFASIERAQIAVSSFFNTTNTEGNVIVTFAEGEYRIVRTIIFSKKDIGPKNQTVTYKAAKMGTQSSKGVY